MDDKSLLERAAKAAGIKGLEYTGMDNRYEYPIKHKGGTNYEIWNPLTDDGDALRLAVKLGIHITISDYGRTVCRSRNEFRSIVEHEDDPYAATRRAITRAAAALSEE